MAGIYIHIPFCARRCIYCGFFSTSLHGLKDRYVSALCRELELESDWLGHAGVDTLYLGGGTPSQLTGQQLETIMEAVLKYPGTGQMKELTIECNPDDITPEYVKTVAGLGFNRISMGVQSFDDGMLGFLHRRHSAGQAVKAIETCRSCGIDNISIDLMYGLPGQDLKMQESDVRKAVSLGVDHLSSYCLSYEPGSPLARMKEEGKVSQVPEETCADMFSQLCSILGEWGFEHYEISNFCKKGKRSMHNSSYWNGTPYLGAGAGAHSFNGKERHWNPDDLELYCDSMDNGVECFQSETLSLTDRYNEYVMLGLRTSDGISAEEIRQMFGQRMHDGFCRNAAPYIRSGQLEQAKGRLRIAQDSLFISDSIISSLFAE